MAETPTSLGKRKGREGESDEVRRGNTIFVSNLPYSATSTDLKTLFSDLGPVKNAFVVLDHATGSSKGVGYVSFAIKEDAQAAFDKTNEAGEGLNIDGRKLRATWADSKFHHKESHKDDSAPKKEPKNATSPTKAPPQPSSKDPLAIRTIVVSGLPASLDSKTLWKKIRKYNGAEKVDWPAQINGVEDANTAHVLFSTPATASEAVSKLHAHVYKGSLLSVTLKKRLDGLAKLVKPPKKVKDGAGASEQPSSSKALIDTTLPAPSRASRLIVRNLPWNVTEQDLRFVFLSYGPIHSIHIPVERPKEEIKTDGDVSVTGKVRAKGYAFVWMLSKKDAEKAIEGANGTKVSAGMADTLVRDKQKKKKLRREEKKLKEREKTRKARMAAEVKIEEGQDDDEKEVEGSEPEEEDGAMTGERVIAVDWALSKQKWEEAKMKMQEDVEGTVGEVGRDEGKDSDEEDTPGPEDSDEDGSNSHLGVHDGSEDSEGNEDDMDVDEKPGRPTLPPPESGTTLFVRNVPFEATDDELRTTFRAFGALRYARITMDNETGRSRGTGFVCFWNKADADKVIEESDVLRQVTIGGDDPAPKKNPFKLPSLLTPDPSASVARNLVLHGRTLDVTRAVTRGEAWKLKEAGERQREKADKRNIYLVREGIILPNTPAAAGLSAADLEKRTQSYNARRALLRTNPSLYVSKTRLSIRQIPLFATERMLKKLALHAVREFEAEVRAEKRESLTEEELTEPAEEDRDETGGDQVKGNKWKAKSTGRVKQAKIVRQHDRVDPITGKGRSKGYGFLEMNTHADALRVLRWANNNPDVSKLFEQWWKDEVEELIKLEKGKASGDGRLERLKKELEERVPKKAKGTLIGEFSIENIQVVKRRAAQQQDQKKPSSSGTQSVKSQRPASLPPVKRESEGDERPQKKRRGSTSEVNSDNPGKHESGSADKLGSLIGRKRKERKKKRAGK